MRTIVDGGVRGAARDFYFNVVEPGRWVSDLAACLQRAGRRCTGSRVLGWRGDRSPPAGFGGQPQWAVWHADSQAKSSRLLRATMHCPQSCVAPSFNVYAVGAPWSYAGDPQEVGGHMDVIQRCDECPVSADLQGAPRPKKGLVKCAEEHRNRSRELGCSRIGNPGLRKGASLIIRPYRHRKESLLATFQRTLDERLREALCKRQAVRRKRKQPAETTGRGSG